MGQKTKDDLKEIIIFLIAITIGTLLCNYIRYGVWLK